MKSHAGLSAALVLLSSIRVQSSAFRFYNNDRYAAEVLPKRTIDVFQFPIPGADETAPAPTPTPAPTLQPFMLERRGKTDNTCAYVSGDSDIPLYCGTDSACIFNSVRSNIGCCPDSNSRCPLWTTCLASSESSRYTSDGYTLLCGNSTYPQCVTHKYGDTLFFGYTLLGCGKTQTSDLVFYETTKSGRTTTTTTTTTTSSRSSSSSSSSTSSSSTSSTSQSPQPTTPVPEPQSGSSAPVGAIAGGVVGGVAVLGLIAFAAIFLVRRNRAAKSDPATSPSAATATTAMNSPGAPPPPGIYGQPPYPQQMGQVQGYPPPPGVVAPGFVPMNGAYDPNNNNRDSMMKYGPHQSVYDPNMGVSPPGSPPPQGYSPVGVSQASPTGTHFTGSTMAPQHTGPPPAPGMGHQSGPVTAYHELPAQKGDGQLRELA